MIWAGFAAVLSAIAGVFCLHFAWKRRPKPGRTLPVIAGWALIAASLPLWIAASGPEYGTAYALLTMGFLAWIAVLPRAKFSRARVERKPSGPVHATRGRMNRLVRHGLLFLISTPVAAVSSALFTIAALKLLPGSAANRMAFSFLLIPVVWGIAAYWTIADTKLVRPAAAIIAAGAAGAALIYL
ncbi:hypothetical protein [Euryhalocaulis caribicus]|uniref:hypothetical protein n=1 Tax=Euryhalocaulis caribicus TaxID=1161401 RepID=UPI00039DFD77|nr:hypothetical protein [Euryhalocaulis caribicus]